MPNSSSPSMVQAFFENFNRKMVVVPSRLWLLLVIPCLSTTAVWGAGFSYCGRGPCASAPPERQGVTNVTPVAGRILETKNRAIGISGEVLLVYNFVPINWLWSGFIYPQIRTFLEKSFHGLFSKKKRSKSGGVPSFPRREHVLAVISLPSGQPTDLDPYHEIT